MRKVLIAATAIAFLSVPAFAATLAMDMELGTSMDQVKESLAQMGYDVRKGEMEDGRIEVYVVKDGTTAEVYVDAATGKVTKLTMR